MDPDRTGGPATDELLRDVLGTLAATVPVSEDAYQEVRAEWTRRQRRRRRLGLLVATLLVVVADVVGLWALNRSDPGEHLIFDEREPTSQHDDQLAPRVGQP